MPDDFVLNVRQIGNYAQLGSVGTNDLLLVQRNGLGGPYGAVSPQALIASSIADAGSLQINGDLALAGSLTAPMVGAQALSVQQFNSNLATIQSLDAVALNASAMSLAGVSVATVTDVASLAARPFVSSVNGRSGAIALTVDDVMGAAPSHGPFFGGTPRADSPAPIASDGELVTAAWVRGFIAGGNAVNAFNGRRGAVRLRLTDVLEVGGAPILDPEFQGRPRAPTPPLFDLSDRLATTRFVQTALDEGGLPGPQGPPGPRGPMGTGFNFRGNVPTMAALPPTGNEVGDLFIASDTDTGYVWDGSGWQPIGVISPSARAHVSDVEPLTPDDGDLWWNSTTGELFVFYQGPLGDQWVIANTAQVGPQGPQGLPGPPGPGVNVGAEPVAPVDGQLWYDDVSGFLMLWYVGPLGGQWVQVGGN